MTERNLLTVQCLHLQIIQYCGTLMHSIKFCEHMNTTHLNNTSDGLYLGADESREDQSDVMPTGRVVGVVQRNWRDYVASFAENEVNTSS